MINIVNYMTQDFSCQHGICKVFMNVSPLLFSPQKGQKKSGRSQRSHRLFRNAELGYTACHGFLCIHGMFFLDAEQFAQDPSDYLGAFDNDNFHRSFLLSVFAGGDPRQHQHSGNHDQHQLERKQGGNQEPCPKSSTAASGIPISVTTSHKAYRLRSGLFCVTLLLSITAYSKREGVVSIF